jgi:8-oxo-dGTP diphosphatase
VTAEPPPAAAGDLVVVVAAAILADDPPRVLAAQRAYPPDLAGLWELPGGQVHAGETDVAALVRECHEELGVTVAVGNRLGGDVAVGAGLVLRAWWAAIFDGTPQPLEHRALRWLAPGEVDEVAWLPGEGPIVAALRAPWPDLPRPRV